MKLTNYSDLNGFAISFLKTSEKLPKAIFSNTDFALEWSSLPYLQMLKFHVINLTTSDTPPNKTRAIWLQSPAIKITTLLSFRLSLDEIRVGSYEFSFFNQDFIYSSYFSHPKSERTILPTTDRKEYLDYLALVLQIC